MSDKQELQVTVKGRFIGGALFAPKETDGKTQYNACVVLDDGEAVKVERVIRAAAKEKWGDKMPAGLQNWGVREGDDPEFAHSYEKQFINPKAGEKVQPAVLAKRNGVMENVEEDDGIVYPGCYVAVSVNAYAYAGDKAKNIKPGVTLGLRGVMFLRDGEPLTDRLNAESEFADFDSEFDEAEEDIFA